MQQDPSLVQNLAAELLNNSLAVLLDGLLVG
jgi:hypothetical protein